MKWDDWAIVAEVSRHRIRLDLPVCGLDQQWPPSEVCMNTVLYPFSILQSATVPYCVLLLPSVPSHLSVLFQTRIPHPSKYCFQPYHATPFLFRPLRFPLESTTPILPVSFPQLTTTLS